MFFWPQYLLELILYVLTTAKKIYASRNQKDNVLYRFIEFNIVRFRKILLRKKQKKCNRVTKLLTTDQTSRFGYNYNLGPLNISDVDSCNKKFTSWTPGKITRCRRLVDARRKLNTDFDEDCNIKDINESIDSVPITDLETTLLTVINALSAQTNSKGGKGKRRMTRKLKNSKKMIEGGSDEGAIVLFVLFCFVIGVALFFAANSSSNPVLMYIGFIIIIIAIGIVCPPCLVLLVLL